MARSKKALAAAILASAVMLTGCRGQLDSLLQGGESAPASSSSDDTSGEEKFEYIKGDITTSDIFEDIALLYRLEMPDDFIIRVEDKDPDLGDTSVEMEMHLTDSVSIAEFRDFRISSNGLGIDIDDFTMYSSNGMLYLGENAMCRSMALYPQMQALAAVASGELTDDEIKDAIAECGEISGIADDIIKEYDKGRYVKLSSSEASGVPVIMMTPVSSTMVSGFFGNDLGYILDYLEDLRSDICRTEDGYHIMEASGDTAKAFFDVLLKMPDDAILGLVMIDTFDDPLWSSINADTWDYYMATVQAYVDSYKARWKSYSDDIANGDLDYSYKLSMRLRSDTDISIKLEMSAKYKNASSDRIMEIKTVAPRSEIKLPGGADILTPEQWDAEVGPIFDERLEAMDGDVDDNDTDDSGDTNSEAGESGS